MRRFTAVAALVVFSLTACSLRPPMKRFSTQEEAGTVHVAVQSIARFDDAYTDQLQPHFELTSEQALSAISQTQISEMERLRALLAEINLAGQKRTVTSERTLDKGEVTKETTTEKTDPPDLSTTGAEPAAKTLTNTAPAVIAGRSVELDQSLRYRAAAALIQEIALFNRYVRDAAVSRGTIPYVVRLLVTVNPAARREPYDVYTTISFFSSAKPDLRSEAAELSSYSAWRGQTIDAAEDALKSTIDTNACERAVEVIPLFVTDNLESSLNSAANERHLDGSGGASGFFANFAATLGLRAQAVDRDRSVAQGLNGLTTISRLGNNTILARLGAATANNQYEMVARTYNVTLLALIPTTASLQKVGVRWAFPPEDFFPLKYTTPCSDLTFTAYSKLRDAVRGKEMPTAYQAHRERFIRDMARTWGASGTDAEKQLQHLLFLVEMGDYEQFSTRAKQLQTSLSDPAVRNVLWHDLVRLGHLSGRSYGKFQLPERTDSFFSNQDVTLFDNGKVTTATLNGARNLTADGLNARIHAKNGTHEIWLDDTAVKISADRHRATFTFPSVKARLGSADGATFSLTANKIESGARGDLITTNKVTPRTTYRLVEEERTPQPTKMAIGADSIRLASGAGDFAVAFTADKRAPAPTVLVEITGATISGVAPSVPFAGGALAVPAQGNYVVSLKNLFADTPVRVRAVLDDGTTVVGEKTLTVRP